MFARFDENPAMTLRVIKETKRYGRTHGRTHGQRENSIPPTNKVCGGYKENHVKRCEHNNYTSVISTMVISLNMVYMGLSFLLHHTVTLFITNTRIFHSLG